jgi:hypothetical protein
LIAASVGRRTSAYGELGEGSGVTMRSHEARTAVMGFIRAFERGDVAFHNVSGQLASVVDGKLRELRMVEALPAESAEFWS